MSEGTIETMLSRIERLERSNRAMKFIAIGAILASVAFNALPALAVFPHGPKAVYAESYNLVTAKGALIATLGQTVNGGYLVFFDGKGKPEMLVGTGAPVAGDATAKSVGAAIYDGNTLFSGSGAARQVWAMSTSEGITSVGNTIYDPSADPRLSNVTLGDGSNAGSFFYSGSGTNLKLRAGIGLGNAGPGTFFNDSTGIARLTQGVSTDDSAVSLAMFNTGATIPLFELSALGDGSATTFQVEDHNDHARVTEGFSNVSGEIIQLHDVNQSETFRAPCTGAACP
jgi:hypothetical protein